MFATATADTIEFRSLADRVEIAPGVSMPRLGLGTSNARGADVRREVREGLALGYRLIDTSANYLNELEIGGELPHTLVARPDVFIITKLESTEFGYWPAKRALAESLDRLQTGYVDLYLIHWPGPGYCGDTWQALEDLQREGKTRAIGVSNFHPEHLAEIFKTATIPPAVNQIELHPYRQRPDIVAECRRLGVTVQSWGPVMRGHVHDVPELVEIGECHGKTAAQVSIRWILQHGWVTIPKSIHVQRLREDSDVFDFSLSDKEMRAIDALDRGTHIA